MRRLLLSLVACLLAAPAMSSSPGSEAPAQPPFSFQPPKGWDRLPVMLHEVHHVGRWISNASKPHLYAGQSGGEPTMRDHCHSVLDVLAFAKGAGHPAIERVHPNHAALLAAELPGIQLASKGAVAATGFDCQGFECVLYGDANGTPQRLLLARACRFGDLELVFQLRCTPTNRVEAEGALAGAVASLKLVEDGRSSLDLAPPRPAILGRPLWGSTPVEFARSLAEQSQAIDDWTKAALPPGWKLLVEKDLRVVHTGGAGPAKELLRDMVALQGWLEGVFGAHVRGKAGRPVVVTLHPDLRFELSRRGEWRGEFESRRELQSMPFSVVSCTGGGGEDEWAHDLAGRGVLDAWFADRDPDLQAVLPGWMSLGLGTIAMSMRAKGGASLEPLDREKTGIRTASAKDRILPAREILTRPYPESSHDGARVVGHAEQSCHASQLLRTLSGPATRGKKPASNLLPNLLACLARGVERERQAVDAACAAANPSADAREAIIAGERRRQWAPRKEELARKAVEEAMADWTAKDWDMLEALHRAAY